MPVYWYDCPDHGSEITLPGEVKPPESIQCHWCEKTAHHIERVGIVCVTPDIPEHMNLSLNQPVRSRRHLRDIQKRTGTQDYEGYRGSGLNRVFGEGGELKRLKHGEVGYR